MRTLIVTFGVLALVLVPSGVAQAPSTFRLHVNDAADLAGANVRCVAKQPGLLMCGGGTSKLFVQFTRHDVRIFRAAGPSAIFEQL